MSLKGALPEGVRTCAAAAAVLLALAPADPALAHGGNFVPPPPPPPPGGRDANPSDPTADPVTTTPDDVVRGPTTPGDWSRWWEFHAPRFLGEDAEPRAALPEKLGSRVTAALRRLADDVNEDIATACLVALGKDGDPDHAGVVLPILRDARRSGPVRESAALAIGLLRGPVDTPTLDALRAIASDPPGPPRLRAFAATALGLRAAGWGVLTRLVRDEGEPADVRAAAATALAAEGGAAVVNTLSDVALAKPRGPESSAVVRGYACQALSRCGGADALRVLRLLLADADPGVRRAAALGLGEAAEPRDDEIQRLLAAAAAHDADREVRAAALLALGRQGHAKSGAPLEAAWKARNDLSPFAGLALGLLARRRGDPDVASAVRAVPDSKEPLDLRGAALVALGLARDRSVLDTACRIASGSADATLQCRAADCLALLRDRERGADALRRLLENARDPILQRHAASALGRLGGTAASEGLLRALRSSAGLFVRADVAVSLGRIGDVPAATELVAVLEDERQPGLLRAMAAVGLGIAIDRGGGLRIARLGQDLDWTRLTAATEELLTIL